MHVYARRLYWNEALDKDGRRQKQLRRKRKKAEIELQLGKLVDFKIASTPFFSGGNQRQME